MTKILCVLQRPSDHVGYLHPLVNRKKYVLERCYPSQGQALPQDVASYKAVIVCGGSMSTNDSHLPSIRAQLLWIPQVLHLGIPLLGICLGGQLLAQVLGATVQRHPRNYVDIGYGPIDATTAGEDIIPSHFSAYHWNQEGFDLPMGAVKLASGDIFPNQAFRYGNAYGLQFHPEISLAMIQQWNERSSHMLKRPGAQSFAQQNRRHQQQHRQVRSWLTTFMDRQLLSNLVL